MMKQFLCVRNEGYKDFTPGKIYAPLQWLEMFGVVRDEAGFLWDTSPHTDGVLKPIETFDQDGQIWIKHDGGECPVPSGWLVEIRVDIDAYRIISTGENEQPVRSDKPASEDGFTSDEAKFGGVLIYERPAHVDGAWSDILRDDESEAYDERPLSPQEAAYTEKTAALQPEPEAPRVFPASALRDMTDTTFASLLGMGQFIGGGE